MTVVDASIERVRAKKARARDLHLQRTYGITTQMYDEMLKAQDYKCAMCVKPQEDCAKALHVDHNHRKLKKGEKFKKVRGLLCFYCNRELVRRHTVKTARLLLAYLLKFDDTEQDEVK